MLTRQPLHFLLADDPGAGKTIMAGLLIKELLVRGDLHRCLICAPGSLVEQWQDQLGSKFHLPFDIITKETVEASRSGNPFAEKNLVIMRLDHVSRNDELQAKLEQKLIGIEKDEIQEKWTRWARKNALFSEISLKMLVNRNSQEIGK